MSEVSEQVVWGISYSLNLEFTGLDSEGIYRVSQELCFLDCCLSLGYRYLDVKQSCKM
jgi:hypothetical protein